MSRARDVATQGGLVLVNKTDFSAVSTISVNNVFNSTYEKYKVILDVTASVVGRTDIFFRFRANGTDNSANAYTLAGYYARNNGASAIDDAGDFTYIPFLVTEHNNGYGLGEITLLKPSTTLSTKRFYGLVSQPMSGIVATQAVYFGGAYFGSTEFDGFTIYPNQGNITGTISVYGYKK